MISDTLASSGLCFSFTSSSKRTSNTTRGLESELAASRRDADPPSTPSDSAPGSLHPSFVKSLELLQLKFEQLMRMQPYNYPNLPKTMPKGGVYLFSEKECHLYVGRSTKIRTTYGRHCNPTATPRTADFAFKLASVVAGRAHGISDISENTKKALLLDSKFRVAFDSAKKRIRKMDFRFVEETDRNSQALLEAYCTLVLNAKYNDFDAH